MMHSSQLQKPLSNAGVRLTATVSHVVTAVGLRASTPALRPWSHNEQKTALYLEMPKAPQLLQEMIERVAADAPCPTAPTDRPSVALIGFPYGCGSRAGAREGVEAIRKQLNRFETGSDATSVDLAENLHIVDLGDVLNPSNADMRNAQHALYFRVREALNAGHTPWVIGGGNDLSALNARALVDESKSS